MRLLISNSLIIDIIIILIFSIGAFSERSAGGVTRDVEGTPKCTQPKCIKTP